MKHITLLAAMAVSFGAAGQVTDGSFEAGIGAGTWTEASSTFGTPLCTAVECGNGGGPAVPRTGDVFAWFGGSGEATEIGSVAQDVNIPMGTTANLLVYVKIASTGNGSTGNYMKAYVDGTQIGMITAADSVAYASYTLWTLPISAYATGTSHNIKIEAKEAGGEAFNILADDIAIEVDGSEVVGLFENEALSGVQVYPNPASASITLSFNAMEGQAVVSITDVAGKVVARQQFSEVSRRTVEFNTSALQDGLYVVTVEQAGKRFTERVVVQH